MSEYNVDSLVKLQGLKTLAQRVNERLSNLEGDTTALRAVSVAGNQIKFFNTTDTTTTAAYTVDFPEEIFLDQAGTTLVSDFEYSAETYPNTTNPNLDGKTVLVLAVKGDKETNPTTKYSFVNMEKLIDIYTASDTSIAISDDYKVRVKISAATNNAVTLKDDGLHVDISGKIDKVAGATEGNVALFNSDGGIANSTIIGANILTKINGATAGNFAAFASDGSIIDSTYKIATDEAVTAMLDEVLPTVGGSETNDGE